MSSTILRSRLICRSPTTLNSIVNGFGSRHLVTQRNANQFSLIHSKPKIHFSPILQHIKQDSRSISLTNNVKVDQNGKPSPPNESLLQRLQPYAALARIDKPTGTLLLYLPCTWSITLAAHAFQLPLGMLIWNTFLFGTGAFIMRGAGCTINDMWDRKLDANVERTKDRPLASGKIQPFQALTFLSVQLSAGLAILVQLNPFSIALGASSLFFVVLYPFMKRITYWPQAVLGLTFNWGALLGWSAMTGSLQNVGGTSALNVLVPLYFGSFLWTLIYDTIYAHQDKLDDVSAGIKSTALLFGDQNTKPILTAFSAVMLSSIGYGVSQLNPLQPYLLNTSAQSFGDLIATGHPFFTASLAISTAHLAWQIYTVNLNSRTDCWSKFRSNTVLGAIIWAGLLLDYTVQVTLTQEEEPQQIS